MAIPIAALLATGARAGVGAVAVSAAASVASTFINPLSREMSYQANARGPSIVPDMQAILGLFYSGRLPAEMAQQLLSYLGVTWANDGRLTPTAWARAIDLARPQFELADYQKWWRQGRINVGKLRDALARKGIHDERGGADEVTLFTSDRESVPFWMACQLFLLKEITEADFLLAMQENGYTPDQAQVMVKSLASTPTLGELLTLWNRGALQDGDVDPMLERSGYLNGADRLLLKQLAQAIPPPTDIIRFSVREVWDQATVDRFGYDEEFPAAFQYWMDKQGLGWNGVLPGQPVPPGGALSWARAYWRSHWYVISPQEAYAMLHRFRGDPADQTSWSVPGIPPFTMDDVRAVLKIHDYPAAFRDKLAALSYTVPRLVDIRNALRFGIRTRAWAVGKFQDRGASIDDANTQADLVEATEKEKERLRQLSILRREQHGLASRIEKQFSLGILGKEETIEGLVTLEYPRQAAELAVARVEIDDNLQFIGQVIRRSKADWMAGRADDDQAAARMAQAGLAPAALERQLARWKVERGSGRIALSTSKILDLVKRGLLNAGIANQWLKNLGWADPERILLLASAHQDLARRLASLLEQENSKRKAAERELASLTREAQRQAEHLQAINRRQTPLAQLKAELKKGTVGKKYFLQRMRAGGYQDVFTKQVYFDVFGEDFDQAGNECGTHDPACGTIGNTEDEGPETPPEGAEDQGTGVAESVSGLPVSGSGPGGGTMSGNSGVPGEGVLPDEGLR